MKNRTAICISFAFIMAFGGVADAQRLDEMSLERWGKLREVERYQLNIAERFYKKGESTNANEDWKTAAAEYEKYLTLYERSEAAPYALMKWSLAQVKLRRQNTAIKEGFQSVIDYFPESPEAAASAYYIANTYKSMGRVPDSKKAYQNVLNDFSKHAVAVYAIRDLSQIAADEQDVESQVKLWKRLTFDTTRTKSTRAVCVSASNSLAGHYFRLGDFNQAKSSLQTSYKSNLPYYVYYYCRSPISSLTGNDETRELGVKLSDTVTGFLAESYPAAIAEEKDRDQYKQIAYWIIEVLGNSRRDQKVVDSDKQMIDKIGKDDELLGRLGSFYVSRMLYEQGRSIFRQFENKNEGLASVAGSFRSEKKLAEAVKIYRQLAASDRENEVRWKGEEAAAYREIGMYAEAIAIYRELLKIDAGNTQQWLWSIATAHHNAGQLKEAIGVYRQCENFPENYKQMASCHRSLKEYREALVLYNQIVGGSESQAPWAQLQIGYTYEQMNAKEPAIKAFQSVCKRWPKNSYASAAHAHLQDKYKISVTLGGAKDE